MAEAAPHRSTEEGAHALGSFVEIDDAKRNVLECMPFAEHHVLIWESKELRVLARARACLGA